MVCRVLVDVCSFGSILLVAQRSYVRNFVEAMVSAYTQVPMSILNRALLSSILTVAHITTSMVAGHREVGEQQTQFLGWLQALKFYGPYVFSLLWTPNLEPSYSHYP